jgi:predicted transcriptional regulator
VDRETLKHAATVRQMGARGMSQRDIAKAVGLSLSTVNRILNADLASEREDPFYHIRPSHDRKACARCQEYGARNRAALANYRTQCDGAGIYMGLCNKCGMPAVEH